MPEEIVVDTPPATPPVTPPVVDPPPPPPPPVAPPVPPPVAAVPAEYTLTLPDSSALTAHDLDMVKTEAKALGLTNEQAQSLVNARHASLASVASHYLAELKADPELGGAHLEETVALAQQGRDWLFPKGTAESDEMRAWFDTTGLGNHKAFVRALARIGKAQAEDRPVGGRPASGTQTKSAAEVLYGRP